jgi:phage antirepressor YoqD-like protein
LQSSTEFNPDDAIAFSFGVFGVFFFEGFEMQELTILNYPVRQDSVGRFCLNDLHRASGGENRHRPQFWLANQQTLDLIKVLDMEDSIAGIPAIEVKQQLGTFVCEDLVYAYAMWLDASFYLKVVRAYRGLVTEELSFLRPKAKELELVLPKAQAYERLEALPGAVTVSEAAKLIGIPVMSLFHWLSSHKWIFRRGANGKWLAYANKLRQGLLCHGVDAFYDKEEEEEKSFVRLYVTPKGAGKLAALVA